MNEKIYIQRKYNKCINILLAIYVVLCLVLSLLFNGFFIDTKAYTMNNNAYITYSSSGTSPSGTYSQTGNLTSNYTLQPQRGIFFINDELQEMNSNYVSSRLGITNASGLSYVYYDGGLSNTLTNSSVEGAPSALLIFGGVGIYNSSNYNPFIKQFGFTDNNIPSCDYIYGGQEGDILYGFDLTSDIEYVDNGEDLYKYLVLEDDSVAKSGDPTKPVTTQDGNLPTPQKVSLWDSAQNCAGLAWDNPKSINKYIKDLGDNVGIEIEWKPSIALVLDMLTVDSLTSSDWLPVYKGAISKSGSLINAFVSKKNDNSRLDNNLNGYNYEIDDKFIFTPLINDNDYLEQIAKNNHQRLWYANEDNIRGGSLNDSDLKKFKKNNLSDDNTNLLNSNRDVVGGEAEATPGEEGINVAPSGISKLDIIQGIITGVGYVGKMIFNSFQIDTSNYRVRYYVKDGNNYTVSNWVDAKRGYDTNENAKEPTNINFTDSNDNPVSNPIYLPANQVTSSDSNNNSWWDRFYSENNNVLSNLQTAFANFTADSGDFFGFFRALFTEFPEFYIFLCMGLGLAIMLRILGR